MPGCQSSFNFTRSGPKLFQVGGQKVCTCHFSETLHNLTQYTVAANRQ